MAGYEDRPGQLAMARAVEHALGHGRILLCEAGTGTGKTLAYLIPALLSGLKVVISTATKTLQDQIMTKDLPLAAEHLGFGAGTDEPSSRGNKNGSHGMPQVALVKGLGNYLCKRRFGELRTTVSSLGSGLSTRSLPLIEAWAQETESGDMAELSMLAEGDPLWREVSSSSETRIGKSCVYHDECFVTKMRKEADDARLLIVNHHLFFADLALKAMSTERGFASALPPYDAVILDEAHQIEDIATQFFGTSVSKARVELMLRDADRAFYGAGLKDPVLGRGEGSALTAVVREASDGFFQEIADVARRSGGDVGRTLLGPDAWSVGVNDAWSRFDEMLETLGDFAKGAAKDEPMRLVTSRASALRASATKVLDPTANQVTWVEISSRNISIGASPIGLGDTLRTHLFEKAFSVVLTSATLTTAHTPSVATQLATRARAAHSEPEGEHSAPDDFDRPSKSAPRISNSALSETDRTSFHFVRSRVGLDENLTAPVDETCVASPFDYAQAALLYLPRDLPEPSDPDFFDAAAERATDLIHITGGGAFVLCTSVRAMRALSRKIGSLYKKPILVQGDAPKGTLLSKFRAQRDGVLVATMSFWEGVDVPGDALRLVIIDKLPFAVPTDPVVAARAKALETNGKSPFFEYFVPQAAITLKQGFGRLIRTKKDRGIVALLDRRAATKSYGRRLLDSLPSARRVDTLDAVRAAWAEIKNAEPQP